MVCAKFTSLVWTITRVVVRVKTFVMTDTSFSDAELDDEVAEAGDEDAVEFGDGEASCLRKRAGAVTVVSSEVVITCSMVDVTVEAWNCVAVAGP